MNIRQWKRSLFEQIRRRKLTRIVQDLDNFLTNVAVEMRLPSWTAKEVLVIAPHPDDETIACGGTLCRLATSGNAIDVLFVSDGAPANDETIRETRRREAMEAARILGFRDLHFLHGQDGDLHLQPWLKDSVGDFLSKRSYSIVFAPWPYDGHSDHAATFRILQGALAQDPREVELWLYETWSPLLANQVIDIDSVVQTKLRAIAAHRSQVALIDYDKKFLSLASYRSLICRPAQYAEAFFVCDRSFALGLLSHQPGQVASPKTKRAA